jgi:glutathione S-transferase
MYFRACSTVSNPPGRCGNAAALVGRGCGCSPVAGSALEAGGAALEAGGSVAGRVRGAAQAADAQATPAMPAAAARRQANDARCMLPATIPMLTVHHLETSRSHRVLWLLEELGVPYELKIYKRDPRSRLAPPELKKIHPMGKSPVITDGDLVVAESGAILEYLVERYGDQGKGDVSNLLAPPGTPEHRQLRFWMHFAEGSLMNWLVMKLVFRTIPTQPMPFFVRPIARQLCGQVQKKLIDPNLASAMTFIEGHLESHPFFAGERLTLADFQMSFAVSALLSRAEAAPCPRLKAYMARIEARPAYQRALAKGGPVIMS